MLAVSGVQTSFRYGIRFKSPPIFIRCILVSARVLSVIRLVYKEWPPVLSNNRCRARKWKAQAGLQALPKQASPNLTVIYAHCLDAYLTLTS